MQLHQLDIQRLYSKYVDLDLYIEIDNLNEEVVRKPQEGAQNNFIHKPLEL